MNKITKLFCRIGGGEVDVLEEMKTQQNKFFASGMIIFMTALFAVLSSAYAFSIILFDELGWGIILPSIVWGGFIFTIDRFFVVTMSNKGSFFSRFLKASPRLILAFFIGVLISKPLEFKIFQREINNELQNMVDEGKLENVNEHQEMIAKLMLEQEKEIENLPGGLEISPLNKRIEEWKLELPSIEINIKAFADSVNCECHGACGTRKYGDGPVCKLWKRKHNKASTERDEIKEKIETTHNKIEKIRNGLSNQIETTITPKYKNRLTELEEDRISKQDNFKTNSKPSILNQQIALSRLQNDTEKPSAYWSIHFITALFIFIEMAPMILKLFTKPGPYEKRIEQIEATYSTEGRLRRSLDLEEYKSNRGLVRRLARSQRNIINKALMQWYDDKMNKLEEDPEFFEEMFTEDRKDSNDQNNHL